MFCNNLYDQIEFDDEIKSSSLDCCVEINQNADNEDNEDDEKKTDWNQLEIFSNKKIYICSNLNDDKLYRIRCRYKNKYGLSPYSIVKSFTTS